MTVTELIKTLLAQTRLWVQTIPKATDSEKSGNTDVGSRL